MKTNPVPEAKPSAPSTEPVVESPEMEQLRIFARGFLEIMDRFGDWDDGHFYYKRLTASELQPLIRKAEALLKPVTEEPK